MTKMIVRLDEVRARAEVAANGIGETDGYVMAARWHSSASDVPGLLGLIDALKPVAVAAREFVNGDSSDAALDVLIEAVDTMPWYVLDSLGVNSDD